MNVCAVCEFWVKGKAQNLCIPMGSAMLFILGQYRSYILQGLE